MPEKLSFEEKKQRLLAELTANTFDAQAFACGWRWGVCHHQDTQWPAWYFSQDTSEWIPVTKAEVDLLPGHSRFWWRIIACLMMIITSFRNTDSRWPTWSFFEPFRHTQYRIGQ